ncbi:MAG TPA: amino acid adenylation domain-containing protein [Streptosporangiaceae bacterium]|jgi:amino acid adenylation domain-containing protein
MTAGRPAPDTPARKWLAGIGPARLARADVFPLSFAQQRLWLADQARPGLPAYHLTRVIDIDGPLDPGALRAALSEIVSRHEALRTCLLVVSGQPLQRVSAAAPAGLPVTAATEATAGELATAAASRPLDPAGPLWRAELYRLGPGRHRLVLVWHHVIADAETISLLLSELAAAYRALRAGQSPDLPPAPGYREYVRWERSFAADPEHDRQCRYWDGQLAGCEPLTLPADRPRPATPRQPAGRVPVRIPAAAAQALRAVARANGATMAQLLLAGYAIALHRFSGRDDFPIGVPVSLRREQRWTHSAGLYVCTLPVRVRIAGNPPFSTVLRQVHATMLAALGAASVPPRRPGSADLPLDVGFGLVPRAEPRLDLPELTTRVGRVFTGRAKFDLYLELADGGPGSDLDGVLEYDAELLTAQTAGLLAGGTAAVLAAAGADPGQRAGHIPLWAGQPGRQGALPAAGGPAGADQAAQAARIDALFGEVARARPDVLAVLDADSGAELTYRELAARAAGLASELAGRGVRRGDFVGVTLPRSAELVVAVLGVLMAGGAYVPLDAQYPAARLAEMTARAGVKLVVGEPLPGQPGPAVSLPAVTGPAGPAAAGAGVAGDGGDPAYVMFTSGSTGTPKAVVVPHRAVTRLVRGADFASMSAGERWLHAAAPAFDASTLELWAPLLNGGVLVVAGGVVDVARLGAVIRDHRVTSAFLTTGLFNLVADTDVGVLAPLRELLIGGEAASAGHVRRALGAVPAVVNGYGPTENTTFTTCHRMTDPDGVPDVVPLGRAIHGTSVVIADGYGNLVPAGVTGEILAGGRGLALGYAGAPGLTAERFVPSPDGPPGARLYRTGDFGRIGPDGLVHFAGRRDDQVKVRGYRIELGAVEQALTAHPRVAQAAVTARTDPSGDRRLIAYIVPVPVPAAAASPVPVPAGPAGASAGPGDGSGAVTGPALARHLAEILPAYMIPGQWVTLPALPLGPTGKVDRGALPAPPAALARLARPLTIAEELLAAWYAELLGLPAVTPDTNFFTVGGHSLLASRLAARIRAVLAADVPLATVFSHPRLADLAAAMTALERAGLPPPRARGATGWQPLSYAQEQVWARQRRHPASPRYHLTIAIDLDGDLDPAALHQAIQAVSGRHPMLRAVFGEHDGQPGQRIQPADTPVALTRADLTGLDPALRPDALARLQAGICAEPFSLSTAPPLRAALIRAALIRTVLIRTAARAHRLLLVVDQLAADEWSLPVICRDLAAAYTAPLPPAAELTYPDYAAWQRDTLTGPPAGRVAGYWPGQLAGAPPRLQLGQDLAGPSEARDSRAASLVAPLPPVPAALAGQVRERAREARATPFAVLLAAFTVLLSRHAPQRDLVIGIPLAGREDAALTDMVGLFSSVLPVRVDVSGEPEFTGLIHRVRDAVVAGLEHAAPPFERIAELAGLPPAGDGQPPVQALFSLQPAIAARFTLGGVAASLRPAPRHAGSCHLAMSLSGDGDGFTGFLEYRSDQVSPGYAAALAAEFTELLAGLTEEGAAVPWTTTASLTP